MISIDWLTKIIFVPKSYTQFVSFGTFEIRQLDIDQFRLDLRTIEAGYPGIVNLRTHTHNTTVEVGGVQLARVVSIINGYSITFEDGPYAVNLNGANSNIADVTNLNQVQIRSANSAGLTYSDIINAQSFNGKIWINNTPDHPNFGSTGVIFPRGTPTSPVNNWNDANFIAEREKLDAYNLDGRLTFTGTSVTVSDGTGTTTTIQGTNLIHSIWEGSSPLVSRLYSPVSDYRTYIGKSSFNHMWVDGYFSGTSVFEDCLIKIDGFHGEAVRCGILGDMIMEPVDGPDLIEFRNCYTVAPTSEEVNFDFSNVKNSISRFSGWNGKMRIKGLSVGDDLTIGVDTGSIILDASNTGGTIHIRGVAYLEDYTSSGCTIDTTAHVSPLNVLGNGLGLYSGNTVTISNAVWADIVSAGNPGTYGRLVSDIFSNTDTAQHILNVHTELLKNNSK